MNRYMLTCFVAGLLTATGRAQTPVSNSRLTGTITYEGMRRMDPSQMRMIINGQEVRPGSPGAPEAPEGMPEVVSFTQKLVFAGTMAKEQSDRSPNMMVRRTMPTPGSDGSGARGGQPRETRMTPPFEQTTFLDLANRMIIEVLTMKKDSVSQTYRTERPMPKAEDWQLSDKTKKIAGYVCHKATVTRRPSRPARGRGREGRDTTAQGQMNAGSSGRESSRGGSEETYTVWYTTDLPFTYSPIAGLTPEKGVVLQIESDSESFKTTSVSMEAVAEALVQPPNQAKAVSPEEMNQLRRKAMADFRQKSMSTMPFPGPGRN